MKLAEAQVMRGLDERAINYYGIPGVVLMENAGRGTVDAMRERYGTLAGQMISVLVGPGNNGGDGLVIARYLHQLGARARVFLLSDPEKFSGDAEVNWQIVRRLPIKVIPVVKPVDIEAMGINLRHSAILVDALFGTGLKREVSGHYAAAIELMNNIDRPVVAVDIPSGLNSDSGQIMGCCAQADLTVTYGLAKPGQVVYPGAGLVGSLRVVDIGIPPEAVDGADIKKVLLQKRDVAGLLPGRPADSHKGGFGHLLVLAGSHGKTGAAILCARGALRTGTGLVSLGSPQKLNNIYETRLAEAMTVPLASDYCLAIDDYAAIAGALSAKKAVVLGPGLGLADETRELVCKIYNEVDVPMVVDADGLNCLALEGMLTNTKDTCRIMTPHPGEMARMTGLSSKEIQADRQGSAAAFAKEHNVILVLKGAGTIIAAPDGRLAINPTGNPGMAAGGMGDVLAGIIGGLLAQGVPAWGAACLGVYLHGLAADRIAAKVGVGFLASEVADEIPMALQKLSI
jgi:NAD(P)H-hydrate epimerase